MSGPAHSPEVTAAADRDRSTIGWTAAGLATVIGLAALTRYLEQSVPDAARGTSLAGVAKAVEYPVYAIALGLLGNRRGARAVRPGGRSRDRRHHGGGHRRPSAGGEEALKYATVVKVTQNALMGVVAVALTAWFAFRIERTADSPGSVR